MKGWIAVEAKFRQSPDDWSLLAAAFADFGCNSSLQSDRPPTLTGYLEAVPGADQVAQRLREVLLELGADTVEVSDVPDQDWSEVWKQHFKPRRIGRHWMVVPSWEAFDPQPDDLAIRLDPGQAFGTGEHPTTELCLELLEKEALLGRRVLDLGCGSGILAIAAMKAGAARATAADIEHSAVEIARENARLNGVELELYAGNGLGEWAAGRRWEVVLSNIISSTLIRLAPEAADVVEPGGVWIVSGILNSNWPDVESAVSAAGFTPTDVRHRDDWVGAALRREL